MNAHIRTLQGRAVTVNIIPMMNLMAALVPFLIVTASFIRLSVIDVNLPTSVELVDKNRPVIKAPEKPNLAVLITDQGFTFGGSGGFLPTVEATGQGYDYPGLAFQLMKIKKKMQTIKEVILTAEPDIEYETIIQVMDACRENGFPDISIGTISQ